MIIWLGLRWWYSAGWYWIIKQSIIDRSQRILEAFSVKELIPTLFAPYRQTFASSGQGSLGDKLRGVLDKTISRFIGLLIRLVIISSGIISMIIVCFFGLIVVIIWPLMPLMPIISFVLIGWGSIQ